MVIRSVKHLGEYARSRRLELEITQAALARSAGVSRQWIVAFEAGKTTAEIGNTLRVIRALDLDLNLTPAEPRGDIDLDELLDA